jgi:hypothetical protein
MAEYTRTVESYDLESVIFQTIESNRLLGPTNPDVNPLDLAWKLDITFPVLEHTSQFLNLINESDQYQILDLEPSSRNQVYITPLDLIPKDGLAYQYWQPGVGGRKDILYTSLFLKEFLTRSTIYPALVPSVDLGFYSLGPDTHFLYSNHSVVQYVDPESDVTSSSILHSQVRLNETPDLAYPVTARIYKRNECGAAIVYEDYKHVDSFTGELVNNERLETLDNGNILWANVDSEYENEFIVVTGSLETSSPTYDLIFNKPANKEFVLPVNFLESTFTLETLYSYLDFLGVTKGKACEVFYTNYLPLDLTTLGEVRVFLYNQELDATEGSPTEWTVVDSLDLSMPDQKHVYVDPDLGLIVFGGQQGDDTKLKVAIDDNESTTLELVDASTYGRRGIIRISNPTNSSIYEDFLYQSKDGNLLLDLFRGYNSTIPLVWPINSNVADIQAGAIPAPGQRVFIEYTAVPRIEYESIASWDRSRISDTDVNPVRNVRSEGILHLYRCPSDVAYLTIEVLDKPLVRGYSDVYGPVYIGKDYVTIKVTAFTIFDMPVPNVEITLTLDGVGTLNGSSTDITLVTDSTGSVIFTYKSPGNPEELGAYSVAVYYEYGNTVIEFDENAKFNPAATDLTSAKNKIYLYQVTKDEPLKGTIGYAGTIVEVLDSSYTGLPKSAFSAHLDLEEGYFAGGLVYLTDSLGSVLVREVKYFKISDSTETIWNNSPANYAEIVENLRARTFHLTEPLPIGTYTLFRAVESTAIEWSSLVKNGRKTIVYRLEGQVDLTHPNMLLATVYGPLRPISILTSRSLLYEGLLPIPSATDNNNYLGAYWSISPQIVTITASTSDTLCKNGVERSASVRILVDLPPSMLGVYTAGSQMVPYGFRILSENFDPASVLNAATFLNINTVGRYGSAGPFISALSGTSGEATLTEEFMDSGFAALDFRIVII